MTARVALVGLRGSGKTTVGRSLAAHLGWAFLDLDAELERVAGRTIPELFVAEGEAGFRRREAALIAALSERARDLVIATGGGAVLDPANRAALACASRVVYLRVPPAVAAARVRRDAASARPALAEGGPEAEAAALLQVRGPLYREAAEVEVDASGSPEAVVASVVAALRLTPA